MIYKRYFSWMIIGCLLLVFCGCQSELTTKNEAPVTISIFMSMDSNLVGLVDSYDELPVFQAVEEKFNVDLQFIMPVGENPQEKYNDMLASGELADIITHDGYGYPGGREAAVTDGYYLDLTSYMETYLKDYYQVVSSDPAIKSAVVTDSGMYASVYRISTQTQGPWIGLMIRKDWLDDLNLEVPVTYDDWEKVLTAFKLEKGAYAPLSIDDSGTMMLSSALSAGYGVMADFMTVTGEIEYGPRLDGWRDYLIMLNRWYAAGLIDPDFMINGTWQVDESMVLSDMTGAFNAMYVKIADYETARPDMEVIPVAPPVLVEGDPLHIRCADSIIGHDNAISASCEHKELAMEILNYFFTEEGAMLGNYGRLGDTYNLGDNGQPLLTDKITNNPEYTPAQAQALYLLPPSKFASYYDWTRELQLVPKKDHVAYDIWGQADDAYMVPEEISYTKEEAERLTAIMEQVKPYMAQMTVAFTLGQSDFGQDWTFYLETLEAMGIGEAIDIVQNAYDRYEDR